MVNILAWIIFGIITGAISRFLKLGNNTPEWTMSIMLGIVGSIIGGFLGRIFFGKDFANDVFNPYNIGMSVVGALIVLYAYGTMASKP